MVKILLLSLVFSICFIQIVAGQSAEIPLNYYEYHILDRLEIKSGVMFQAIHTSDKPFRAGEAIAETYLIDTIKNTYMSSADRQNEYYLRMGHDEFNKEGAISSIKPLFKYFYTNKADLFKYVSNDFMIRINPIINFQTGQEKNVLPTPGTKFINTRGVDIAGWIGRKLGFYANITENQFRPPLYFQAWVNSSAAGAPHLNGLPGFGYYKNFKINGFDYMDARGHINIKALKIITLTIGHDKNFIGNGYRSLLLSDNAAPYDFAKIQVNYKMFEYEILYADMISQYTRGGDHLFNQKMYAMHHLSANLGNHVNLGLFEAVMSSTVNGVRLGYFNPLILYRSQEYYFGNPDKDHVGFDIKINAANCLSFYGQLLIDDFNFRDLKAHDGWWGNKQGYQAGVKYIDALSIKNLDLQLEFNQIAPYTYMSKDTVANYSNFNQSLAHPWGANLREFLGIIKYKAFKHLYFTAMASHLQSGINKINLANPLLSNYGQDLLYAYLNRPMDYGVKLLQGDITTVDCLTATLSYELKYNMFIDIQGLYRTMKNASINSSNGGLTNYGSIGFRMFIPAPRYDF